ncbi:uncharacterized protein [Ptychodera flava]|uniref:uncharacterized protein n=1 Tax=Ptychodera flava TaxID=63121 RepID=UPI003969F7E6
MATVSKTKCQYWDKCYRKDPTHLKTYLHPDEKTTKTATTDGTDDKTDTKASDDSKTAAPVAKTTNKRKSEESSGDETAMKKAKAPSWDLSDSEPEDDDIADETTAPASTSTTKGDEAIGAGDGSAATTSTATADVSPSATTTTKKPKCNYWDKCYRKNSTHLKAYLHPDDVKPKNKMDDGESVDIEKYRIKRTGDSYYCTCIGWKTQSNPVDKRTCKHLKAHLGEEFENVRLGEYAARRSRRLSVSRDEPQPKKKSKAMIQLLLAHKWTESVDPTGWWMSEKLDGVRAWWDGYKFRSRLGNTFYAPAWFTKDFPTDMELDGELFGGRGMFQSTVSIVKSSETDERWKKITFHVFDAPNVKQGFEQRMQALEDYFTAHKVPTVKIVDQTKCKGADHLTAELKRINGVGGEGVMIREPKSKYENCRSKTLLKIKTFHDAEARVVGYEEGKGRNQGRVGALRCQMANGKLFSVGSGLKDAERRKPPKKGTIIVYKFQEYSNSGTPRFPTYVGVAADKTEPKDCILESNKSLADKADA